MSNAGFVYVLSNNGYHKRLDQNAYLLKIGVTSKNPIDRAKELYTTGVPFPFDIEFVAYSSFALELEREIHEELKRFRVNGSREFFYMPIDNAVKTVANAVLGNWDMEAEHFDFIVDRRICTKVQDATGCAPPDVRQVLNHVSPCALKAAYAKLIEIRERSKSSSSTQVLQQEPVSEGGDSDA